ncbi:MAG: phosphotyrosine protein phosphatase [Micromonosporaceae bacterium]
MTPFSVLHVCMGNICRSPMAERLLRARAAELVGPDRVDDLLLSHSTGTGAWHVGQPMNPPAARQLRTRGVDPAGFAARQLVAGHIAGSDLILTATAEQSEYVRELRPDAADRVFVLGELGRLLRGADLADLPAGGTDPDAVYARGVALVELADRRRAGAGPEPGDDLDDPYGMDDTEFGRIADQIDATVRPLAGLLFGERADGE